MQAVGLYPASKESIYLNISNRVACWASTAERVTEWAVIAAIACWLAGLLRCFFFFQTCFLPAICKLIFSSQMESIYYLLFAEIYWEIETPFWLYLFDFFLRLPYYYFLLLAPGTTAAVAAVTTHWQTVAVSFLFVNSALNKELLLSCDCEKVKKCNEKKIKAFLKILTLVACQRLFFSFTL